MEREDDTITSLQDVLRRSPMLPRVTPLTADSCVPFNQFLDMVCSTYNHENLMFWEEVQVYKSLCLSPFAEYAALQRLKQAIVAHFIVDSGSQQINIEDAVKQRILAIRVNPPKYSDFDEAEKVVEGLLVEIFKRFQKKLPSTIEKQRLKLLRDRCRELNFKRKDILLNGVQVHSFTSGALMSAMIQSGISPSDASAANAVANLFKAGFLKPASKELSSSLSRKSVGTPRLGKRSFSNSRTSNSHRSNHSNSQTEAPLAVLSISRMSNDSVGSAKPSKRSLRSGLSTSKRSDLFRAPALLNKAAQYYFVEEHMSIAENASYQRLHLAASIMNPGAHFEGFPGVLSHLTSGTNPNTALFATAAIPGAENDSMHSENDQLFTSTPGDEEEKDSTRSCSRNADKEVLPTIYL